jgi:hypothetical protein
MFAVQRLLVETQHTGRSQTLEAEMHWYLNLAKRQFEYVLRLPAMALPIFIVLQMFAVCIAVLLSMGIAKLLSANEMLIIIPFSVFWLHTLPAYWLAIMLLAEKLWMMTSLYRVLGVPADSIRNRYSNKA